MTKATGPKRNNKTTPANRPAIWAIVLFALSLGFAAAAVILLVALR